MNDISKNSPTNNVNILLYHQIGDAPNARTNLDCFCNAEEFYLQMQFLKNSDYKVIPLSEALDLIFQQRTIDSKYVVLTFDDGCEKFYDVTFPILEEFGFPSMIYPVAGFLGKHATWSKVNNPELKILSKRMLVELNKHGVEIGAHTMDHVKLTKVNRAHAISQVEESKDTLQQLLGKNIDSFAYPHGDFDYDIINIIKNAGFSNGLTCLNNYAEEAKSLFEIPRKYITFFDDLRTFKQRLN